MSTQKSQPVLVAVGIVVLLLLFFLGSISQLWHSGRIVLVEHWTILSAGGGKINVARRSSRFGGSENTRFEPSLGVTIIGTSSVNPVSQWLPLPPKSDGCIKFSSSVPPRTDYHWTLNWKK